MVRPRASEQNIRTALAFAETVMVQTSADPTNDHDGSILLVARKGRRSIHAAFAACLPQLARDSLEKRPNNRHGVAVMELNKAMQAAGLRSVRKRDRRIDGGVRWRSKVRIKPLELTDCVLGFSFKKFRVSHGFHGLIFMMQYWSHRRWANPSDPRDRIEVAAKLAHNQQMYVPPRQCSLEQVLDVISRLHTVTSKLRLRLRQRFRLSPHSSRPDKKAVLQIPSLEGQGWRNFMPDLGQAPHLPPLSNLLAGSVGIIPAL